MKFRKHHWERNVPLPTITNEMIESKINLFYPGCSLDKFEIVSSGLANINIFFKLTGKNDPFLLRIYNRDNAILDLEIQLSRKFGHLVPMPEFLYVAKQEFPMQSFVIQKWFDGIPFYKILKTSTRKNLILCAKSIAYNLSLISSQKFLKAGFFKNDLEIEPYETDDNNHPFVSYIEDCLFKGDAGKNLGNELRDTLWNYIVKNKEFFPNQEPACLVHGDFNFDNILINPTSFDVIAILDWEFSFSGSYLFDIGTFFRFDLPDEVKSAFINTYENNSDINLPNNFEKMIKIQDISNFVGLINHSNENVIRIKDVKSLIQETLKNY